MSYTAAVKATTAAVKATLAALAAFLLLSLVMLRPGSEASESTRFTLVFVALMALAVTAGLGWRKAPQD